MASGMPANQTFLVIIPPGLSGTAIRNSRWSPPCQLRETSRRRGVVPVHVLTPSPFRSITSPEARDEHVAKQGDRHRAIPALQPEGPSGGAGPHCRGRGLANPGKKGAFTGSRRLRKGAHRPALQPHALATGERPLHDGARIDRRGRCGGGGGGIERRSEERPPVP